MLITQPQKDGLIALMKVSFHLWRQNSAHAAVSLGDDAPLDFRQSVQQPNSLYRKGAARAHHTHKHTRCAANL
jgi:hypothetical protein